MNIVIIIRFVDLKWRLTSTFRKKFEVRKLRLRGRSFLLRRMNAMHSNSRSFRIVSIFLVRRFQGTTPWNVTHHQMTLPDYGLTVRTWDDLRKPSLLRRETKRREVRRCLNSSPGMSWRLQIAMHCSVLAQMCQLQLKPMRMSLRSNVSDI